jgi:streptogramin lyase
MSHKPSHRAEILREYGPFQGAAEVHGVTYDGASVWFASGQKLHVLDPDSGQLLRELDVPADAGSAFDGRYLYQLAGAEIHKIDPQSGKRLATIPAPQASCNSGLAWGEGFLWLGQYNDRKIYQLDPKTGAILRRLESNRFVTGVSWVDGELWHGTADDAGAELRQLDPHSGEVLHSVELPAGVTVSGLESDGAELLFCGGGRSGKLRAVRRPRARR